MRVSTLLAAGIVAGAAINPLPAVARGNVIRTAGATQPVEVSAARRKPPRRYRAPGPLGTQVACTRYGCRAIPRGCHIETEYNLWTWNPSGYDAVVCPSR